MGKYLRIQLVSLFVCVALPAWSFSFQLSSTSMTCKITTRSATTTPPPPPPTTTTTRYPHGRNTLLSMVASSSDISSSETDSNSDDDDDDENNNNKVGTKIMNHNEFSRIIFAARVFRTAAGKQRRSRDYQKKIEATLEECQELAHRFNIADIQSLAANCVIRRAPKELFRSYGAQLFALQVHGTINALVTQTCVRTNEKFEMQVEFPISCVVRPTSTANERYNTIEDEYGDNNESRNNNYQKKRATKISNQNLKKQSATNIQDMMELQDLMLQAEYEDGYYRDLYHDVHDAIVEDENIYSIITGQLDLGELVAQTFWLQLDPYPKKPGTKPIRISFSG